MFIRGTLPRGLRHDRLALTGRCGLFIITKVPLVPVPNPLQPQSYPSAAIAREKAPSVSFWLLTVSVSLYVIVLILGTLRSYVHLHTILLLLQYGLLLPAVIGYLRRQQNSDQALGSTPTVNVRVIVVGFALLALPLSWLSVRGLLNPDESGYSFQARIYRSGRIMADPLIGAPSDVRKTPAELYYANHVLRPNGWFPKFPPGWPLVLSLGYLISARWLLTPVFGLAQLLVIAACGSLCFSKETGSVAVLVAILSPFYLVNSIGMMSHALCALLAATACFALFRGLATGGLWYYTAMFACLAATLQVRPYTGFVLTLVLSTAALWLNRKNRSILVRILAIGIFFGAAASAGVLVYNHIYSGNWFVSPYAMAAGANLPPELTFNPIKIWQGLRHYGWIAAQGGLIGAFPFSYLLAGYAVLYERKRRTEVWILASLYVALVLAYLAHSNGYAVFFGERFHFEAFFALLLLAARGFQLVVERWHTPRRALVWTLLLFVVMQVAQQAMVVETVARRGEPYRKVREALAESGISGLVLLHDSPGFVAQHFNLNDADWRHASRLYLVDAEPDRRSEWACRYGLPGWTVVSYDAKSHHATFVNGRAECSSSPALTTQP